MSLPDYIILLSLWGNSETIFFLGSGIIKWIKAPADVWSQTSVDAFYMVLMQLRSTLFIVRQHIRMFLNTEHSRCTACESCWSTNGQNLSIFAQHWFRYQQSELLGNKLSNKSSKMWVWQILRNIDYILPNIDCRFWNQTSGVAATQRVCRACLIIQQQLETIPPISNDEKTTLWYNSRNQSQSLLP